MEKKLGVFFTTIVTHINTTTLSIFSNPNTNVQSPNNAKYFSLFLSLYNTYACLYIYSPTHDHVPSIVTSVLSFRLSVSRVLLFLIRPTLRKRHWCRTWLASSNLS